MTLRLAACLVATAFGCTTDEDPFCEQTTPPSPEASVSYLEIYRPFCEFLERCAPEQLASYVGGDVASCVEVEQCPSHPFTDWTVTPACVAALDAASCEDDIVGLMFQSDVCAVGGPLPAAQAGEACQYPVCRGGVLPATFIRCDDGLFCGVDDLCAPNVAEGQRCSIPPGPGVRIDPCEPGTYCESSAGRCTPDIAVGEVCEVPTGESDHCERGSACQDGVCTAIPSTRPRAALGESCAAIDCLFGLICIDEICEPRVCPAVAGDRCDPYDSGCGPDLTCNSRHDACEPTGPECDEDRPDCPDGTFCDRGTCQTS